MGRRAGQRNSNFEEKRHLYTQRALNAWLEQGAGSSLRELARACETSVTNLKHYFGDRDGLFEAITNEASSRGRPFMDTFARPGEKTAKEALTTFLRAMAMAWQDFEVGRIHVLGLGEGLEQRERGMSYVNNVLEPTIDTGERLIAALIAQTKLPPMDVRAASLSLISPVFVGLLHQQSLYGRECRPLDLDDFITNHIRFWLHGYATPL